jgi:predicted Rdx family selenoprotein
MCDSQYVESNFINLLLISGSLIGNVRGTGPANPSRGQDGLHTILCRHRRIWTSSADGGSPDRVALQLPGAQEIANETMT